MRFLSPPRPFTTCGVLITAERKAYHAEQRQCVVKASPARGQGFRPTHERCDKNDAHDDDHCDDGVFFTDADKLHADEHHACAQNVEYQNADEVGQTEPLCENGGGSREKGTDIDDDGHAEENKRRPRQNGFDLSGEKLRIEALDKLRTVVVVAELRNDKVQHESDEICKYQYEHGLPEAVVRGEIRNGEYACADAVTDDYARGFEEVEPGFTLHL